MFNKKKCFCHSTGGIFNSLGLIPVKILSFASLSLGISILLASCETQTINEYEATAVTTITWRVNYSHSAKEDKQGRDEEFASASLTNRNGEKPDGGIVCPHKLDLWCPKIPPQPSIDEVEARRQNNSEKIGRPERLWQEKYYITYQQDGQTITLPTNYQVYRQVVKAYPEKIPLELTMGINNGSVEKATPIK